MSSQKTKNRSLKKRTVKMDIKPEHVIKEHQVEPKIQKKTCLPHASYFLQCLHQVQVYSSQE